MNISTLMYLVVCIVSVLCAFISTIITFIKSKSNKTNVSEVKSDINDKTITNTDENCSKTFEEILNDNLLTYMEQAENLFKTIPKSGTTLKLPWVIDKITMDCIRNGVSYSTDDIKNKVAELTEFSKNVNKQK